MPVWLRTTAETRTPIVAMSDIENQTFRRLLFASGLLPTRLARLRTFDDTLE